MSFIAKNMVFFYNFKVLSGLHIHVACAVSTLVGCLVPLMWIFYVELG